MNLNRPIFKIAIGGISLALALILPFLTGQIPQIGSSLCPMHLPIFICGFLCGPWYGLIIGFVAPLLRFVMFGMPTILPSGIGMAFELATYGFVSGLLYQLLPKKKPYIYVTLLTSMLVGRIVWGITRVILYGVGNYKFGWAAFMAGAFTNAIPGIILQIILIPLIIIALEKTFYKSKASE